MNNVVVSASLLGQDSRRDAPPPAKTPAKRRRLDRILVIACFFLLLLLLLLSPRGRDMRKSLVARKALEPLLALTVFEGNNSETTEAAVTQEPGMELTPLEMPQADRVKVMLVPRSWNRYDLPWFEPVVNHPPSFAESRYRITYAPTKNAMSDGLGHSMTAINYELLVALRFGLAYSHRRSTYSSLTAVNKDAVENFFGWGDGYVPREAVQDACEPEGGRWVSEGRHCMTCERLKEAPQVHGVKMERVVTIPYKLAHKCASHHNGRRYCDQAVREFLAANNESHTVFQLPTNVCEHPTSDSDMNDSKGLFFAHYWRRHARRGQLFAHIPAPILPSSRPLRFQENRLNIAVHIRRGDFLRSDVKAKRGIMKDEIYAAVVADAIALISKDESPFRHMPVTVHVYSEGGIDDATPYSSHATEIQNKQYFDAAGEPRDAAWWTHLMHGMAWRSLEIGGDSARIRDARVEMHISDDTLTSLHEMIAADVFVGSRSGLSTQLVWSLSRGIVVVPVASSISLELGKIGDVCCSIPFDHDTGAFDRQRFSRYWRAYARANGPSAERAFSGIRRRRRRRRR